MEVVVGERRSTPIAVPDIQSAPTIGAVVLTPAVARALKLLADQWVDRHHGDGVVPQFDLGFAVIVPQIAPASPEPHRNNKLRLPYGTHRRNLQGLGGILDADRQTVLPVVPYEFLRPVRLGVGHGLVRERVGAVANVRMHASKVGRHDTLNDWHNGKPGVVRSGPGVVVGDMEAIFDRDRGECDLTVLTLHHVVDHLLPCQVRAERPDLVDGGFLDVHISPEGRNVGVTRRV